MILEMMKYMDDDEFQCHNKQWHYCKWQHCNNLQWYDATNERSHKWKKKDDQTKWNEDAKIDVIDFLKIHFKRNSRELL